MSLKSIKSNLGAERGFTIVELLIVVVVIAILAAITIVSYNGITGRANESAVKAQAATYQKKAELYQAEVGRYPVSAAELSADTSKSWYVPTETYVTFPATLAANTTNLPNDTNATKRLFIFKCNASTASTQSTVSTTNITGVVIYYLNPNGGTVGSVNVGNVGTPGTNCAV